MTDFVCPQCGARYTLNVDLEAPACLECGTPCAVEDTVPAVNDEDVIDVQADPLGPDDIPRPVFRQARVRTIFYEGRGLEGQGCCCLGCFAVAFIVFLLLRGLLSLLGLV